MSYVRTITYTFPAEKLPELYRGSTLFLRVVSINKLLCQESDGLIDNGVWVKQDPEGLVKVISYTEWSGLNDMDDFDKNDQVTRQETIIAEMGIEPSVIEKYEVIS